MKKISSLLIVLALFVSCNSDDDFGGGGLQPVSFLVTVKYDTATYGDLLVKEAAVTLTNNNTGDSYNKTSNTSGVASFESILPGTYNVTVTKTLTSSEFSSLFGYEPSTDEVTFNGSQEQVVVSATQASTALELKSARIGNLVIKQIYYSGSSTTKGAVFRDQFIEIYNNSNETIYADSLYVGQLYGKINTNTESYTLNNGQFDWTKSIGMTDGKANTNYVYADYVLQIPGSGTDYPIAPGKSIVIAQTGINHKEPLLDNSGKPLSVEDPTLTVDLSNAEFEVYLGDFRTSIGEEPYRYDIQNPAVKDMLVSYWGNSNSYSGNKDFLLDNNGRDSFVIFRTNELETYTDYPDPSIAEVVAGSTKYFLQLPTETIIDGVELQHYNPSSQRPKMLQSEIDASFINCDAAFNSQSVIRKIKTTIDGRIILQDSNNSADDFVKLSKANPKGFAE